MSIKNPLQSKRGKVIIVILILVLVIAVIGGILLMKRKSQGDGDDWTSMDYTGTQNNYYMGLVEAQETWNITQDSSKEIDEIFVEVGDNVSAGQVLFTYKTADALSQLESAKIEIDSLQNDIVDYNNQIASLQQQMGAASEDMRLELNAQISEINVSIKQAQLSMKTKQVEMNQLTKEVENASVTSKIDGVVQQIRGNEYFMSILSTGGYRIKGTIDELNVYALTEGQECIIHSRVSDEVWKGKVTEIESNNTTEDNNDMYGEGQKENAASKYHFYVVLEDSQNLRMGQHVYIEVVEPTYTQEDVMDGDGSDAFSEGGIPDAEGVE